MHSKLISEIYDNKKLKCKKVLSPSFYEQEGKKYPAGEEKNPYQTHPTKLIRPQLAVFRVAEMPITGHPYSISASN